MNHMRVRVDGATKRKKRLCRTPLYRHGRVIMLTNVEDVDCQDCLFRLAWRVEESLLGRSKRCLHTRAVPTTAQVGGPVWCRDCGATTDRDGRR